MSVCKNNIKCFIFILILLRVSCYEKTLRKIIRSQSKMVQRPFSDSMVGSNKNRRNISVGTSDALMFSGQFQMRKMIHKLQRPKVSTVLTQVDKSGYGKLPHYNNNKNVPARSRNMLSNELRLTRDVIRNLSFTLHKGMGDVDIFAESDKRNMLSNKSYSEEIAIDNYYEIPSQTKIKSVQSKEVQKNTTPENIIIPNNISKDNTSSSSSLLKSIFISNSEMNTKPLTSSNSQGQDIISADLDSDRIDFLIQGKPVEAIPSAFTYNTSSKVYSCTSIHESKADIFTQEKFISLDIEPDWMSRKHYWNSIFDSRYESLMRNPKWPPLKVILVPRTQVDSIWKKTFERGHNDSVHRIISNVVKKLQYYNNLTFSWNEISHLTQWWKTAMPKSRSALRRLLKQGRLEIAVGGWVETDEATSHIFGLVHQLIEGQQWLKNNLNYVPEVAWLTNSVTHSPTMTYLLSASGINKLIITNLHYSWEEYFAEYQYSDFIWVQNWESDYDSGPYSLNTVLEKIGNDRLPKHSVLTHILQFNSADFRACGPNQSICKDFFNFAKASHNIDVFLHKIKQKAEILLEQYSKTGTITSHNTIIAPLGGSYHFEKQTEFDYQYNYYKQIADYVNTNREIYKATIEFGTAKDYFNSIYKTRKSYPTLVGDFVNYADLLNGSPAYWTGYFTTRPWFKILLRRTQSALRSAEIILSFAVNLNVFHGYDSTELFKILINARESVARLQDRHVVSGTLTANTIRYIYRQILATVKNCWYIQEVCASLLSVKPNKLNQSPYLQKYVYRDGEFSLFRTVGPGDQIYVFNSLSHERTEVIELMVRNPNLRIIDHNKKEVTIQINPVWKYHSDNFIRISKLFYKILFAITVPPLTLELYRIKETSDSSLNVATIYCSACVVEELSNKGTVFPFDVQRVEPGDIQLESYKHRLIFDEHTGFLKLVIEKHTGTEKRIVIDYGAFRSSDINSGIFLFNTNVSKPLRDIIMPYRLGVKSKVVIISSGQVTTELTSIYGKLLQSTVKIYNLLNCPLSNAIHIESRVDYEASPKNREIELFMSIQSNINNGNPPILFTDNNGFQYTARILNISRRIESNMYPMTTMSFIQDQRSRLTVITDHAQGVTALQEGQIVLMLDRRVLFDDKRGTGEGLSDSIARCHTNLILLENFLDNVDHSKSDLQLPSFSAIHLAKSIDYQLEVFVIDRIKSDLCHYTFLPLVKTSFPCDVSLITYRINFEKGSLNHLPSNALMVLHRQSIFCHIDYDVNLHCNGDINFSLEKIMYNVKAIYKTNLSGTNKGVPVSVLNKGNFSPMELATLKIYFNNN